MRAYSAVLLVLCVTSAVTMSASNGPDSDIVKRSKSAEKIVVASIVDVQSRFDVNSFGDQLIVSDAVLQVEETLKGAHLPSLDVTVEGGTVGDLTLTVSDMPKLTRGERAVLFLRQTPAGTHLPYGRGSGILKLNANNQVEDSNLSLEDVKRMVRQAR